MGPSQLTESLDIQSNIEAFSFAAYLSFLPRLIRKRQEKSTKSSTKIHLFYHYIRHLRSIIAKNS